MDRWQQAITAARDLFSLAMNWWVSLTDYQYTTLAMATTLLFFSWCLLRSRRKLWRTQRGVRMTRGERIFYRKQLVADIITDGLELAEYEGKLSRVEVTEIYRKLGRYMENGELLPPRRHIEAIKKAINDGTHNIAGPVKKIPGPTPGEKVASNVVQFKQVKGGSIWGKKSA